MRFKNNFFTQPEPEENTENTSVIPLTENEITEDLDSDTKDSEHDNTDFLTSQWEIQTIKLDKIVFNTSNFFSSNDNEEEIVRLAMSINSLGLLHIPLVQKTGEKYLVISGEKRIRAITLLGWKEVECRIVPENVNYKITLAQLEAANIEVRNYSAYEWLKLYQNYRKLYNELVQDGLIKSDFKQDASKLLGKSQRQIAKFSYISNNIDKLTEAELEDLKQDNLTINQAYKILQNRQQEENSSLSGNTTENNSTTFGNEISDTADTSELNNSTVAQSYAVSESAVEDSGSDNNSVNDTDSKTDEISTCVDNQTNDTNNIQSSDIISNKDTSETVDTLKPQNNTSTQPTAVPESAVQDSDNTHNSVIDADTKADEKSNNIDSTLSSVFSDDKRNATENVQNSGAIQNDKLLAILEKHKENKDVCSAISVSDEEVFGQLIVINSIPYIVTKVNDDSTDDKRKLSFELVAVRSDSVKRAVL